MLFNTTVLAFYIFFCIFIIISNLGESNPFQAFFPLVFAISGVLLIATLLIINFVCLGIYLLATRKLATGKQVPSTPKKSSAKSVFLIIGFILLLYPIYYAVGLYIYKPLSQEEATALIRDCKVSEVQQINNSELNLNVVDADPSKGPITAHGDLNILENELEIVKQKCTYEKRAYSGSTAITSWLTLDETLVLLKQCKIDSIQAYVQAGLGANIPIPEGTPTEILYIDYGGDSALLYADVNPLIQIDKAVKQSGNSCETILNYTL